MTTKTILSILFPFFLLLNNLHAQTAVSYEEVVQGAISTSGEEDQYTFTGQADEVISIRLIIDNCSASSRYIDLIHPNGNTIASAKSTCAGTVSAIKLPVGGVYRLVVKNGNSAATSDYKFTIQKINDAANANPIAYNTLFEGAAFDSIQFVRHTFEAIKDEFISVRMGWNNCDMFASFVVFDVAGNALTFGSGSCDASRNTLRIPATGTYFVLVYENSTRKTAPYTLQIQKLLNSPVATNLAYEDKVDQNLTHGLQTDIYTFSGKQGDVISMRFAYANCNQASKGRIELYRSNGQRIKEDRTNCGGTISLITLPVDDEYTVVFHEITAKTIGEYSIALQKVSNPEAAIPIEYDSTFEGVRPDSLLFVAHSFEGEANESIGIVFTVENSIGQPTIFQIHNEKGELLQYGGTGSIPNVGRTTYVLPETGTYYILVYERGNIDFGQYTLTLCREPQPSFEFDVQGDIVYFYNTTTYKGKTEWAFGDEQKSTDINPTHVFSEPGVYMTCLTEEDCTGLNKPESCDSVIIVGINGITPNVTGRSNYYVASVTGAGFFPGDSVRLVLNDSIELIPDRVEYIDLATLDIYILLENAPTGIYDIYVEGENSNYILEDGLTIEENTPISVSSQIVARNRMLVRRFFDYQMVVTNHSNQTVYAVPAYLSISGDVEVELSNEINNTGISQDLAEIPEFTKVESEESGEDSVRFDAFVIPFIRSNSSYVINFKIKVANPQKFKIQSANGAPWFKYEDLGIGNDGGGRNNGSNNKPCDDIPCEILEVRPEIPHCFDCFLKLLPLSDCTIEKFTMVCKMANLVKDELCESDKTEENLISLLKQEAGTFAECFDGAEAKRLIFKTLKRLLLVITAYEVVDCVYQCANGPNETLFEALFSLDPNLKEGTATVSVENYISGKERIYYTIYFENADSATAPASEVLIIDTLDTSVLDINTLKFHGYNFGTNTYQFDRPIEVPTFTREIDLRPNKNAILRIRGDVDKATGIVKWLYTTYDPATYALTQDIFEGFLPPNVNKPEGEGFVQFSIMPKADLPHLATIDNKADIYFDVNDPIVTPIWSNPIDKEKPSSQIIGLAATQVDTMFELSWEGTDNHSGIAYYDVFYSENGVDFSILYRRTINTSATFTGELKKNYYFYSVAIDYAGNVQDDIQVVSTLITNTKELVKDAFILHPIRPNPFNKSATISFEVPEASPVLIEIINAVGERQTLINERLPTGKHTIDWKPTDDAHGIYYIRLKTKNTALVRKVIYLE